MHCGSVSKFLIGAEHTMDFKCPHLLKYKDIKPKNHSSLDIHMYEVSPHFGFRNSSLKVCPALLMHAVYTDGQHKGTAKRTTDIEVPESQEARQAATRNSCGLQGYQKTKLDLFLLNYVQPYDERQMNDTHTTKFWKKRKLPEFIYVGVQFYD